MVGARALSLTHTLSRLDLKTERTLIEFLNTVIITRLFNSQLEVRGREGEREKTCYLLNLFTLWTQTISEFIYSLSLNRILDLSLKTMR